MIRFFLVLFFAFFPSAAFSLSGDWQRNDTVSVRLISGVTGTGDASTVPLGLEVRLAQGWHTYWRSPGSTGLPPTFDWSRSQTEDGNLKSVTVLYPFPRREASFGMETIGYSDTVVFPIEAALLHPGQDLKAGVTLDILTCGSVCLPNHFDLDLTVPAGKAEPSDEAELLRSARERLPGNSEESGLLLKSIASDGQSLTFTISSREPISNPDIFVENDREIGFGKPEVAVDSSGFSATLRTKPVDSLPDNVSLNDLPLTLTVVNGDLATEVRASAQTALPPPSPFVPERPRFGKVLLIALLGGFILNLMPCVLPVLSLKIVSVVGHGGKEAKRVRHSFVVTGLGIVFSFLILAAGMIALKLLGMSVGWGMQFQQPAFLMFLVFLLAFFAANMWGFFDVALPRFLMDKMNGKYHPSLAGDFATGAFATLLATPCSAPFLGTAVGFALAAGPIEILGIFAMLGVGMALPYFAVALFPDAATLLPKPGIWMVRLKQVMGIALASTAAWLIYVMSAQILPARAWAFGLLTIAIILLLALRKFGSARKTATAGVVVVGLAALILGLSGNHNLEAAGRTDKLWLAYTPARVRANIDEGKTVFLDVTADWCITCKANKAVIASNDAVARRLFHGDVVAIQANWTNPDPAIVELLHKYGRYGIPFNAVFGPRAPNGIVLPEILTPGIVLRALDAASSGTNF